MTVTNFAIHIWYNDSAGNLFAFTDPWALYRTVRVTKTPFSVTNLAYLPFISLLLLERDSLSALLLENLLAGKVLNFSYRTFGVLSITAVK